MRMRLRHRKHLQSSRVMALSSSSSSSSVTCVIGKMSQLMTLFLLLCCGECVWSLFVLPSSVKVARVLSLPSQSVARNGRPFRRHSPLSPLPATAADTAFDDALIHDLDLPAVLQQVADYTVTRRGRQALLDLAATEKELLRQQQQRRQPWSSSSSSSSRQRRVLQEVSSFFQLQQRSRLELHVAGDVEEARCLYEQVEQAMLVIQKADKSTTAADYGGDNEDDSSLDSITLPPMYGIYESDKTSTSWPWQVFSSTRAPISVDTDDDEFLDITASSMETDKNDWTLQDVLKAEQVARRILNVRAWAQSTPIVTWAPLLSGIIIRGGQEKEENDENDGHGHDNHNVSSALQSLLDDIGSAVEIVRVKTAMDPTGKASYSFQLSGRKYPILAMLRQQIQDSQSSSSTSNKKTNKKISDLQQALEETEHEITIGLFASVARQASVVDAGLQAVAQLDVVLAKAAYGVVYNGVLPRVVDEAIINISGFVHPLLLSTSPSTTTAVPVDLKLGLDQEGGNLQNDTSNSGPDRTTDTTESHALIISGPNGGGKTLAMKSFGLVSVLVKLGIPLPVRSGGSRNRSQEQSVAAVGFFDQILTAVGDRQSVTMGQSTFMALLSTYASILERVGSNSLGANGDPQSDFSATKNENILVLLDELGSGTEAEGGGAIGQAVLEHMLHEENSGRKCRVVATTHSRRLKALGMDGDRFDCATVLLQNQAGLQRPSYRLEYGLIGESFALEAAGRATPSLPETVIQRATELVQSTEQKQHFDDSGESRSCSDEAYIRALRKSMEKQNSLAKAAHTEARKYVEGMQKIQKSLLLTAQQYERKWNGWQVRLEEAYRRLKQGTESHNGSNNNQQASLKVVGDTLDELRLMRQALPNDKERLAQQGLRLLPDDYELQPDELVVIVDSTGKWDGLEGRIVRNDDTSSTNNYLVSVSLDPWSEPEKIAFSRFQLAIWDYSSMWEEENNHNCNLSTLPRRQRVDSLLAKIDTTASKSASNKKIPGGPSNSSPQSTNAGTTHTSARARKAANGNKKRKKK